MPWFQSLCRNLGLTVHNIIHPDGHDDKTQTKTLSHTTEEQKVSDTVTLRRTTIEEVEVRKNAKSENS